MGSDIIVVSVKSSCNLASQRPQELINKNAEFNGELENESIICVKMG